MLIAMLLTSHGWSSMILVSRLASDQSSPAAFFFRIWARPANSRPSFVVKIMLSAKNSASPNFRRMLKHGCGRIRVFCGTMSNDEQSRVLIAVGHNGEWIIQL